LLLLLFSQVLSQTVGIQFPSDSAHNERGNNLHQVCSSALVHSCGTG
jgi:hypothetical protein